MKKIRRLWVYCGSSGAVEARFREAASELGARLAAAGIELVYGGGRVGLMGLLAEGALTAGGKVTGIIPGAFSTPKWLISGLPNSSSSTACTTASG